MQIGTRMIKIKGLNIFLTMVNGETIAFGHPILKPLILISILNKGALVIDFSFLTTYWPKWVT